MRVPPAVAGGGGVGAGAINALSDIPYYCSYVL